MFLPFPKLLIGLVSSAKLLTEIPLSAVATVIIPGEAVLFTAPQIPAGMTGFHRNPVESSGMGPESSGIHWNRTGILRNPQ